MTDQDFLFENDPDAPTPEEQDEDQGDADEAAKPKKKARRKKAPKFEEALERLETIVGQMERGEMSLEDCLKHFEEGSALAKLCAERLKETEKKVEVLLKDSDDWQTFEKPDE